MLYKNTYTDWKVELVHKLILGNLQLDISALKSLIQIYINVDEIFTIL